VEHYEIAGYGCLSTWAEQLSPDEVNRLLAQTLREENQTDQLLNQIAEKLNQAAEHHASGRPS